MKIILASKSPRRKEILENLGYSFTIVTADVDENCDNSNPAEFVKELAFKKAKAVAKTVDKNSIVIGCDTVVAIDNKILGKPIDKTDAENMLKMLSDNKHSVFSGLCVIKGEKVLIDYCKTDVYFDTLSQKDIDDYLADDEYKDKAGSYAIQGKAGVFVKRIDGEYFNVVGLPINLLHKMLKEI